jgi:hypothetical protein
MAAEYENSPGFVPYHPDPRLSDKAATLQPLYDYYLAATSAEPCHFPHYNHYMGDRIFGEINQKLTALLPDGRDDWIAYNHLSRHSGPNVTECATLKLLLEKLRSATGFQFEQ